MLEEVKIVYMKLILGLKPAPAHWGKGSTEISAHTSNLAQLLLDTQGTKEAIKKGSPDSFGHNGQYEAKS